MVFNETWIRKNRCRNGALGILQKLEKFTADDIIILGFVQVEDEKARELLYKYEQMILLAKMDEDKYFKERDNLHTELAKYIHDNELYSDWVDFIHFLNDNMKEDNILNAYKSEAMETWNYLTKSGDIIYGLTRDNQFIETKEYYGDWDYDLQKKEYQFQNKKISEKAFLEYMKKNFASKRSIEANENLSDIATFEMLPFINERTKHIYPTKWMPQAEPNRLTFPRMWKRTEVYKELLMKRKFMLDRKGVKLYLKNAEMFDEVLIVEDLTKDKQVVMLYRATSYKLGSTMGYYIPSKDEFFSAWKLSDGGSFHQKIENFILELYTEVVVGLEKDRKRFSCLVEVEDINDLKRFRETNIYVEFAKYNKDTDKEELKGKRAKGTKQKPHERSHSIRKLREGQQASEEAIERAKEYGIELQEGYTYVSSYKVGGLKEVRKQL